MRKIASYSYRIEDQKRFSELSGDRNPVHLDRVASRREIFGDVVVHGIHLVFRSLEEYSQVLRRKGVTAITILRLKARFPHPAYLNRRLSIEITSENEGCFNLAIRDEHNLVMELEAWWRDGEEIAAGSIPITAPACCPQFPRVCSFSEISGKKGEIPLYLDPLLLGNMFPQLKSLTSVDFLGGILSLTRMVGMECPGLNSIFYGFEIQYRESPKSPPKLTYEVILANPRSSMMKIKVGGKGFKGTVEVFYRPLPLTQPAFEEIRDKVIPSEFIGQKALVIGGSRGLGEVTAKIVAAGGGYPVISYHKGIEDARRVANEIQIGGGVCRLIKVNALSPWSALSKLAGSNYVPSHIYYFATPKILANKTGTFNSNLFKNYSKYYVESFYRVYQSCRTLWPGDRIIFYPSSIYLDEMLREFMEYSCAKASGEMLCSHLNRLDKKLYILIRRLPRVATDQTITMLPYPAQSALKVMLKIIREMSNDANQKNRV